MSEEISKPETEAIEQSEPMFNRELSWLSFNYRVLQEAKDERVPILERLRFMGIYSSNLEEFYQVRVASVRSLDQLKKKVKKNIRFSPGKLLDEIHVIVEKQQEEFGQIFREQLLPQLAKEGIFVLNERKVNAEQKEFVSNYFESELVSLMNSWVIDDETEIPFLENRTIYLVVTLEDEEGVKKTGLVKVPSDKVSRFLVVPGTDHNVLFLDDVIRLLLHKVFVGMKVMDCYSVKLSRDADLYIEDEFTGDLVDKIRKSLEKRNTGVPSSHGRKIYFFRLFLFYAHPHVDIMH